MSENKQRQSNLSEEITTTLPFHPKTLTVKTVIQRTHELLPQTYPLLSKKLLGGDNDDLPNRFNPFLSKHPKSQSSNPRMHYYF